MATRMNLDRRLIRRDARRPAHGRPAVCARPAPVPALDRRRAHRRSSSAAIAAAKPVRIVGIDRRGGVAGHFRQRAPRRHDTGTPHAIASSTGKPNPSSNDGSTSITRLRVETIFRGAVDVAGDRHVPARGACSVRASQRADAGVRCARQHQRRRVGRSCDAGARRPRAAADVLARLERADEQDVPPRTRSSLRRRDLVCPRRRARAGRRGRASAVKLQLARALRRRRSCDDTMTASARARVRPRPAPGSRGGSRRSSCSGWRRKSRSWMVTTWAALAWESAAGAGCAPRRCAAGEPLDRRPFQPVPGQMQRPHGDSAVDDAVPRAARMPGPEPADPSTSW